MSDTKGETANRQTGPRRVRTADRRAQIARVTLRLIAERGLSGASLARISSQLGITDTALYRHFANKDEILVAAFDVLAERVFRWIESSQGADATERLEAMGKSHADLFSQDIRGFNVPMFQFNVWIPRDKVRRHVDETHLAIISALARVIEDGKLDGSIRQDVDVDIVVSQIYAWIWWEDLSYLRELDPTMIAKESAAMMKRILADISIA